jgi:putative ABC transport system substrate-binding protein
MIRKFISFALGGMLLTLCLPALAQQAKKIPRVGYLATGADPSGRSPFVEAFRQGLRDLGYIEGKNILVEYRYAEGKLNRVPTLVAELVQLNVDVLVLGALSAIRAAKQATSTTPIVMMLSADPVATGIFHSLARPGGNVTGLSTLGRDLSGKRLELLKEAVPGMSRVGYLWDVDSASGTVAFKEYEAAAHSLKIPLQSLELHRASPDFEGAFQGAVKARVSALITDRTPAFNPYAKRIGFRLKRLWAKGPQTRKDLK